MKKPECFGGMLGSVYDERGCDSCPCKGECLAVSSGMPDKKPLDGKWVDELINTTIGPNMAMLAVSSPHSIEELTRLIKGAVTTLYDEGRYQNTNDWVNAACNRVWSLYNTYITARLITLFDKGIPDKSTIVVAKKGKILH